MILNPTQEKAMNVVLRSAKGLCIAGGYVPLNTPYRLVIEKLVRLGLVKRVGGGHFVTSKGADALCSGQRKLPALKERGGG